MILQCTPTSCYRLHIWFLTYRGREYDDNYYPIIKSITVRDSHQCQNVVVPARIRSHGSDLTSRRSLLVYRHHFRSTLYVFTEVSHTSHSLIPYTGTAILSPVLVPVILCLVLIRISRRQKVTRFFFEITPLGPHMQCSLAFDGLDGNQRSRPLRTTDPSRFPFPVPYIHAQAVLPYLSSHSNT
jgi:hypothetical protein